MSGRPYLRTVTAALKRSWFVTTNFVKNGISSTLKTRSKYAAIHQFGGVIKAKNKPHLHFKIGSQWIKKKSVKIPKRLKLFEAFRKDGPKILKKTVLNALSKAVR